MVTSNSDVDDIEIDFDYQYFFDQAKSLEEEGSIDSLSAAINFVEGAIDSIRKTKENKETKEINDWLQRFNKYENRLKTKCYTKAIRILKEKAEKEEEVFKYDKAVTIYHETLEYMNNLYKLGNKKIKPEEIKELQSKIKELEKKIKNHERRERLIAKRDEKKNSIEEEGEDIINDPEITIKKIDLDSYSEEEAEIKTQNTNIEEPVEEIEEVEEVEETKDDIVEEEDNIEEIKFELTSAEETIKIDGGDILEILEENTSTKKDNIDNIDIDITRVREQVTTRISNEIITEDSLSVLKEKVETILESCGYSIFIFQNDLHRNIHKLVDMVALKVIEANEFLDVCHIVPIKISNLYGSLIVSESKVKYNSADKDLSVVERDDLIESILIKIKKINNLFLEDLKEKGSITKEIISFIDEDLSLEQGNFSMRNNLYRNGQLLYKFQVQPIIISHKKVGFLERNLPYAYQLKNNLYFTNVNDLFDLLSYLKIKILSVQKICIKKQPIDMFAKNKIDYSNYLMLLGIFLGVFGFFYFMSAMFLNDIALSIFSIMQYPVIVSMVILFSYITRNYYKNHNLISSKFEKEFCVNHPDFSEKNLNIALNQINLSSEQKQFLYEIYKKKKIPEEIMKKIKEDVSDFDINRLYDGDSVSISASDHNLSLLKRNYKSFTQKSNFFKSYCILRSIFIVKLRNILNTWLGKPNGILEDVHNFFDLIKVFEAENVFKLKDSYEKTLKFAEKHRKNQGNFEESEFNNVSSVVFEIIQQIQKSRKSQVDSKKTEILISSPPTEEVVFEKSVDLESNFMEDFMEDD